MRHPAVPLTCCVPLEVLADFSGLGFSVSSHRAGNVTCLTGPVSRLYKEMDTKHWAKGQVQSKSSARLAMIINKNCP